MHHVPQAGLTMLAAVGTVEALAMEGLERIPSMPRP